MQRTTLNLAVALLACAMLGLLAASSALADGTITTVPGDGAYNSTGNCTLRDALSTISGTAQSDCSTHIAGTITGNVTVQLQANGSYGISSAACTADGPLAINANTAASPAITSITIQGNGATIDGNNGCQILTIGGVSGSTPAPTVSINSTTIQNGLCACNGGAILNNGSLTLNGDTVQNNHTANGANGGSPSAGGGSSSQGGAMYSYGPLTITNSTLTGNSTGNGGNGADGTTSGGGGGGNTGQGGALYFNDQSGALTITGSLVSNNHTGDSGAGGAGGTGAAGLGGGNGGVVGGGGGIFGYYGSISITSSRVTNNSTGTGGAGGTGGSPTTAAQAGGNGGSGGGPVQDYNDNGGAGVDAYLLATVGSQGLSIVNSTVDNNHVGTPGAGGNGGTGNGAAGGNGGNGGNGGQAGGVWIFAPATITNTTIVQNVVATGGAAGHAGTGTGGSPTAGNVGNPSSAGGVYDNESTLTITYGTIAGNSAGQGGGVETDNGASVAIKNSILSNSSSAGTGSGNANCLVGPIKFLGASGTFNGSGNDYNGDPTACPASSTNASGNPVLGSLQANGGSALPGGAIVPTEALGAGSKALDLIPTANCTFSNDERGVSRPQPTGGNCDAGAYEVAPPTVTNPAATQTGNTSGSVTVTINPNAQASQVKVEYGTSTSYGSATAVQATAAVTTNQNLTFSLTGLNPGTAYHVRIDATNPDGTTMSTDQTFTTTTPPPPPPALALTITHTSTLGATLTIDAKCAGGSAGQVCTEQVAETSHETTQGGTEVAVAAKKKKPKPKPKPKVTKQVTVGTGSFAIPTGQSATITVTLNATGKSLLAGAPHYKLPATLAITGTTSALSTVTYTYTRITSPISFTWSFGSTSTAQSLSISHIPSGGKVQVICNGRGCPFGSKTLTPSHGTVSVAKALKHAALHPHTSIDLRITAPNDVGKVAIFTMRFGAAPSLSESCLTPGATKPTACL
jgi:hypothetical protein